MKFGTKEDFLVGFGTSKELLSGVWNSRRNLKWNLEQKMIFRMEFGTQEGILSGIRNSKRILSEFLERNGTCSSAFSFNFKNRGDFVFKSKIASNCELPYYILNGEPNVALHIKRISMSKHAWGMAYKTILYSIRKYVSVICDG